MCLQDFSRQHLGRFLLMANPWEVCLPIKFVSVDWPELFKFPVHFGNYRFLKMQLWRPITAQANPSRVVKRSDGQKMRSR